MDNPLLMNLVKCHQRGVFVPQVKCCHVGGVKFSIQPSSQITHLNGLKTMTSKFFFGSPLSQSFTKKTLSHNLLSTCEKWNRFCGRYNTPCFLSQKMSLLLLKNFSFSCPSPGHVAIKIYIIPTNFLNFLCCPGPPKIMCTLNLYRAIQ